MTSLRCLLATCAILVTTAAGCGQHRAPDGAGAPDATGTGGDAVTTGDDGGGTGDGGSTGDGGGTGDGGSTGDAAGATDGGGAADAATGVISGGPCMSGAPGATAYRIRWAGNGANSTAYPVYEVSGLPDHSRDHAGAFGYQIGFTPTFTDIFLGVGGLQLDGSDFIDLELSTVGVSQISKATLSVFGRSFNTTASGSFHWQTFEGTGTTATNAVSNSAPYQWYGADMTTEISPGDHGVLVRIKAGPSSGSLIVNRVELCIQGS